MSSEGRDGRVLSPRCSLRSPWFALGAVLVVYVVTITLVGRFPFTDEIAFKAAGREWAQTGRFAAPELWDFRGLRPPVQDIWFAHLPVYTFLYGLVVKIVGFGLRSAIAFDATIHALLAAATAVTARTLAPALDVRGAAAAALAVLPLGILGRPDDLAILLALLGLRHLHAAPLTAGRAAVSGGFFGASAATSAGVAFQLGLVALPVVLLAPGGRSAVIRNGLAWCAAAAAVCGLLFAPLLVARPDALEQYRQHAATQVGSTLSIASYVSSWRWGKPFVCLAAGSFACAAITFERSRRWVLLWSGPVLATLNLVVFFPFKWPYAWFVGPWVIAALAADMGIVWRSRARRAGLLVVVALWMGGTSRAAQDFLMNLSLPAEQRYEATAARVRAQVPPGSRVLAFEHWPALASDHACFDPLFADVDLSTIDYIVLTGNASGQPGRPVEVRPDRKAEVATRFSVVDDGLGREPNRILGVRISRSAYGWGAVVLKRVR